MRNANGYGSVIKLSGNRRRPWACRKTIGWKDTETNSYPIYKYISYHTTRKEAVQALAEYNKDPYTITQYTFDDIYEKWLAQVSHDKSASTLNLYEKTRKNLEPLSNKKISETTKTELQEYFDNLEVSKSTLKNIKTILRGLYTYSAQRNYVPSTMKKAIDDLDCIARVETKEVKRRIFTKSEIDWLWEHKSDETCRVILIYIYTGLRYSELQNLTEEYCHDDYITVRLSKTKAGIRDVPLSDKVKSLLPIEPLEDYQLFRKRFNRVCSQMGTYHTIHDTRHTFVTLLTEANIDPRIIKQVVGHKSRGDVTEEVYTHISMEKCLEAVNKI